MKCKCQSFPACHCFSIFSAGVYEHAEGASVHHTFVTGAHPAFMSVIGCFLAGICYACRSCRVHVQFLVSRINPREPETWGACLKASCSCVTCFTYRCVRVCVWIRHTIHGTGHKPFRSPEKTLKGSFTSCLPAH